MEKIDVEKLKKEIAKTEKDWCIACGAGASAAAELIRSGRFEDFLGQEHIKVLAGKETIVDLSNRLGKLGERAWCIACGASASPADTPALTDEDIKQLAVVLKKRT